MTVEGIYRIRQSNDPDDSPRDLSCLAPAGRLPVTGNVQTAELQCQNEDCLVNAVIVQARGAEVPQSVCPVCRGPLALVRYLTPLTLVPAADQAEAKQDTRPTSWAAWGRSAGYRRWTRFGTSQSSPSEALRLLQHSASPEKLITPNCVDPNR